MKALLTWIRVSPKKADLIAWMVRWMEAWKAVDFLKFLDKKWAELIWKVLSSAIANAENNFKASRDDLYLSRISITKWPTYKRWRSRSKWRVFAILKRTANIDIELWIKKSDLSKKEEETSVANAA